MKTRAFVAIFGRKQFRFHLGFAYLFLTAAGLIGDSNAQTNSIVAPAGLGFRDGNGSDPYLFHNPGEIQQFYSSAALAEQWNSPVLITSVAFRVEKDDRNPFLAEIPRFEIEAATTQRNAAQLTTSWESNQGGDAQLVFERENLTLSAENAFVLNPFDLKFTFSKPFYYDPSLGNLLLRLKAFGDTEFLGGWDVDAEQYSSLDAGSPYATIEADYYPIPKRVYSRALVTQFTFEVVPEPQTLFLFVCGILVYGVKLKRSNA